MELGVTVEAYDVSGGRVRHINSGFLVVEALGSDAVAVELRVSASPDPTVDPEVAGAHHRAIATPALRFSFAQPTT